MCIRDRATTLLPYGTFWRGYNQALRLYMIHAPSADYGHRACRQLLLFHGSIRRGIAQGGTAVHTVIFGNAEAGEESTHVTAPISTNDTKMLRRRAEWFPAP